jgi:hypothetical protein
MVLFSRQKFSHEKPAAQRMEAEGWQKRWRRLKPASAEKLFVFNLASS